MPKIITGKQRIIDYLNRLVAGRLFQVEDLESLTAKDLQLDTPIQDIDEQILQETLDEFRNHYKSRFFKDS